MQLEANDTPLKKTIEDKKYRAMLTAIKHTLGLQQRTRNLKISPIVASGTTSEKEEKTPFIPLKHPDITWRSGGFFFCPLVTI